MKERVDKKAIINHLRGEAKKSLMQMQKSICVITLIRLKEN